MQQLANVGLGGLGVTMPGTLGQMLTGLGQRGIN